MLILQTLLLPPLLALALCMQLGYAFSRTALPPELRPYRGLLAPLAGCALFLVVTAALTTWTPFAPPQIAAALALLAVPVNVWVLWRGRRRLIANRRALRAEPVRDEQRPTSDRMSAERTARLAGRSDSRLVAVLSCHASAETLSGALCVGAAALVFALALLPLLRWGMSTPIGSNWDAAEFYVPLGRVLQLGSQHDIAALPRNPLVHIFTTPPVSGRIHAFSYLHAAISSASGVEPLDSYAPLMAFVLALQPLAFYPLARVLQLPRAAAVLATLLLALAWLPLWVAYNNFSNHLMALPLLPIALASGLVALRSGGRAALVSGALFVAALATGYYPAMTAYVTLLAPAALYLLWRAADSAGLLRRGLALTVLGFAFSLPAQIYFFLLDGFRDEIARYSTGFQIARFVELHDALGLAATFNRESSPSDARLLVPAAALALLLGIIACCGRRVPLLVALGLGAALYQAFTAARAYHYGFYKGVTFEIPLYVALIAAGAALIWDLAERLPRGRLAARALLAAGLMLILGLNASTIWRVQSGYSAAGPQLWSAAEIDLAATRAQVPAGATVLVVPSDAHAPTFNSLISYALLGHALVGDFSTGYTAFHADNDGQPADVALLPATIDPTGYGYDKSDLRWSGGGMQLFGRAADVRYHRALGSGGRYPALAAGESLTLRLGPHAIMLPDERAPTTGPPQTMRLALAVAGFQPAQIELTATGATERHSLASGLSELTSAAISVPSEVRLRNIGNAPIYLWWGELRDSATTASAPAIMPRDDVFVQVLPQPATQLPSVRAAIRLHTQPLPENSQKLTGLLTVAYTAGDRDQWQEQGRWVFFPSNTQQLQLHADLERMTASLAQDGRATDLIGSAPPPRDGEYQATLLLANNGQIVYGAKLWTWRMRDGRPDQVTTDPVVFDVVPLPRPATPHVVASQDGTIRLRGYTLPRGSVRGGETIELSLVWQSLRKLDGDLRAHVILRAADGRALAEQTLPLGSPDHGTSTWQEGEVADQPFALALPKDAPGGTAALAVELLRADGRPVPFRDAGELLKVVEIEIVR